jgi:hypothetical protein
MSQSFNIDLNRPAGEFIEKAKAAVEKAGGSFRGDENAGGITVDTLIGNIKARYEIAGTTATIHIDNKPFLLSMGKIQSALSKYLV